MKPTIIASKKGRLTVNDNVIDFDFIINSSGEIMKRVLDQKEDNDHSMKILTLSESNKIYDPVINEMIIGWRSDDKMMLSNEATDFFDEKIAFGKRGTQYSLFIKYDHIAAFGHLIQ